MNRRRFLSTITAAIGALALDPERALWVPGAKTIFVPKAVVAVVSSDVFRCPYRQAVKLGDIITLVHQDLGIAMNDYLVVSIEKNGVDFDLKPLIPNPDLTLAEFTKLHIEPARERWASGNAQPNVSRIITYKA